MRDTFYPDTKSDDPDSPANVEFRERMKTARHWLWYAIDVESPPSRDNRVDHLSDNWFRLAWFIATDKTLQAAIKAGRYRHCILPKSDKRTWW